jgi:hypothetical protein
MTLSDSILLHIGQSKTTYNDLLTRILPNYSSKASAKAALSRALKNLMSFENIQKDNNYYLLTEKGKVIVESKIKNKILLNINELIKKPIKKENLENIDEIVKHLQIFLERSKQDSTLLKVGKTSATFYIRDLMILKKDLEKKITHLSYLNKVLEKQILILQEQNFEDVSILNLNGESINNIIKLAEFYNISEITIDCDVNDKSTIDIFEKNYVFVKKTPNTFVLKIEDVDVFKKILFKNIEQFLKNKFKVYVNEVVIKLEQGKLYFFGPHNVIVDIKEKIL